MSADTYWITFPNVAGMKPRPEWARRSAIDPSGQVWLSSLVTGRSETEVFLCAGWDGVPTLGYKGHTYFPAEWLAREYPANADVVEVCVRKMREIWRQEEGREAISAAPGMATGGEAP